MRVAYLSRTLSPLNGGGVRCIRTLRRGAGGGGDAPQFANVQSRIAGNADKSSRELLETLEQWRALDGILPPGVTPPTQRHKNLVMDYVMAMEKGLIDIQDKTFWRLVRVYARLELKYRFPGGIDLFALLFQLAKKIEDMPLQGAVVFELGRCIYRQKDARRLDASDEIRYYASLTSNKRAFQALKLWRSRASQDQGNLEWGFRGVSLHLQAQLPLRANIILEQRFNDLLSRPEYTRPEERVLPAVVALIDALAQQLSRGNQSGVAPLERWVEFLLKIPVSDTNFRCFLQALVALISCRQWKWSREVLEKIPLKVWDDEDAVGWVLLAFLKSAASSKALESPQHFEPLLKSLPNQITYHPLNLCLSASMILHYACIKEISRTHDLLGILRANNIDIPEPFQKQIARELVQIGDRVVVDEWLNLPEGFAEILRLSDHHKAAELARQYMDADGKLSGNLAYRILKLRFRLGYSFLQDSQVLKLGVTPVCQEFVWYLSATRRLKLTPDEIFKQPWRPVSEHSVIYICQAFFNHYAPDLALTRMFEGLNLADDASPGKATILLRTIKKLVEGRRVPMLVPKPKRHREQVGASLGSWNDVIERAQAILQKQEQY